jgi:hypothetical protein
LEKQEGSFSCYNVTTLPKSLCSTLFAAGYRRPAEGGLEAFCFYFGGFLSFGFGYCFGLFGVGRFWKGKELLKGNC